MKFVIDDFVKALEEVIWPTDQVVIIHSGIWTFGHLLGVPISQVPDAILDAISGVVGEERTLLMPTFTLSYTKTRTFNLLETKPETGILGQALLKHTGALRTISALNSFAAKGPHSGFVRDLQGKTLWGEGTIWEWFEQVDARICSIGLPLLRAISIAHRAEEIAQVPYRYFKTFKGTWCDGRGNVKDWKETMFVRALAARLNYEPIVESLNKRSLVLTPKGRIPVESALSHDIVQVTLELLKGDPLIFVSNRGEICDWIKNERETEISQLSRGERSVNYLLRKEFSYDSPS